MEDTINAGKYGTNELIWIGFVLITIGVIFTLGTLTGIFLAGDNLILVYGPIVGGIGMVWTGIRRRKQLGNMHSKFNSGYFRKRS